jgi:hypothetical protein
MDHQKNDLIHAYVTFCLAEVIYQKQKNEENYNSIELLSTNSDEVAQEVSSYLKGLGVLFLHNGSNGDNVFSISYFPKDLAPNAAVKNLSKLLIDNDVSIFSAHQDESEVLQSSIDAFLEDENVLNTNFMAFIQDVISGKKKAGSYENFLEADQLRCQERDVELTRLAAIEKAKKDKAAKKEAQNKTFKKIIGPVLWGGIPLLVTALLIMIN